MLPTRVLVTIVALVIASMTFVASLAIADVADENETLIATVLGFASLAIVQLVTNKAAADKVSEKVDDVETKVDRVLNGEMTQKVTEAIMSKEVEEKVKSATRSALIDILDERLQENGSEHTG